MSNAVAIDRKVVGDGDVQNMVACMVDDCFG